MLYHKDIFLPRKIRGLIPAGWKTLQYTFHAGHELSKEGVFHPPMGIDLTTAEVVEVSTYQDKVDKVIVRIPCMEKPNYHFVLALIPTEYRQIFVVKTGWLNHIDDIHRTLDPRPYVSNGKIRHAK